MTTEQYHAAITEAWKFMRRWLTDTRLRSDLSAWVEVVDEAQAIADKYGSQFVTDVMSLILGEVERIRMEEFRAK